MSHNTVEENRARNLFGDQQEVWLFGYGSLIYIVDFPYLEARPASIRGWSRRFWQGSHDHRGTPENPGRVVTLIEEPGAVCGGMAFRIKPHVFEQLDEREKNGYLRVATEMTFTTVRARPGSPTSPRPTTRLTSARPASWKSRGKLPAARARAATTAPTCSSWRALRELGQHDDHVFTSESRIDEVQGNAASA